jgi:hypothetical protein
MGSGMEDRWTDETGTYYRLNPKPKQKKVKTVEVDKIWGNYKGQYKGCIILPKSWVGKKVIVTVVED